MIIDAHLHLDNFFGEKLTTAEKVDMLIQDMDKYKINKAIVMTATHSPELGPGIKTIIKILIEKDLLNKRLFLLGSVSAKCTYREVWDLERLIQNKIICGLKLYPGYENFYPYESQFDKLYRLCLKYNLPCFFHSGSTICMKANIKHAHPLHLENVALKYPRLKIVICHLGMPWYQTCAMLVERHPNVYADISGFLTNTNSETLKILKQAILFVKGYTGNYDKLIFGTDWSICSYADYLKLIDSLELTASEKENLLFRNILKIILLRFPTHKPYKIPPLLKQSPWRCISIL